MIVEYTRRLQGLSDEIEPFPWIPWGEPQDLSSYFTIWSWFLELLAREEFTKLHRKLDFGLAGLNTKYCWELKGSSSVPEMILYMIVNNTESMNLVPCSYHNSDFFALLIQKHYL